MTGVARLRERLPLAARATDRELLELDVLGTDELETNLADLARLNRLPGGTAASVAAIADLLGGEAGRVLDVGTGSGDLPLAFARRGWRVVAVDNDPRVLAVARRRTGTNPAVEVMAADGRSLPFADGAFDVAHCSLVIHHLDPDVAVAFLRELARVGRRGVVLNDLRRGAIPLLATAVSVAVLGRCRATRHDGLLSARRAYTLPELDALLAGACLRVGRRSTAWMPRVVTTAHRMDR